MDLDPCVWVGVGGTLRQAAAAEREEQSSARQGHYHFLEAVHVVIRGAWAGLAYVLRDVAGCLIGLVNESYVYDVRVAGGDVPFLAELDRWKVRTATQDVEVGMPVL